MTKPGSGERIAKVIARAGLASRREAEAWIAAGRVAVNGEVIASPALNVTAADRIAVDGEPLPARERTRLFLYHKPRGLVTTHADPGGRPTIFAALPQEPAAADQRRPARPQHRGPAAAHQRRRARAHARAAGDRLAAPLPRARPRPRDAGAARPAAQRHHHRRHPLRRDRGHGSTACRAPMSGSPSPSARARTARSRTCSAISGWR